MKKLVVDREVAYWKSLEVLKMCSSSYGFVASGVCSGNYCNVWSRDSMVCLLASLMSEDKELVKQSEKSLKTLLKFQYKQGQIPSNVDVKKGKVSYGGSAGRVDATLWFLIGFAQYVKRTKDKVFLKKYFENFKKAITLVRLYEFNDRNLIYVPKGGDWADEYIQEGYVLYDQLLYWRAWKEYVDLRKLLRKSVVKQTAKLKMVGNFIRANYSLKGNKRFVYHPMLYKKIRSLKEYRQPYLLPFFNPSEYGSYFDGFANSLALHFGFIKNEKALRKYVEGLKLKSDLLPSFHPVIRPGDKYWEELKDNFSVRFRNAPGNYQNGGLWPVITGFYASGISDEKSAGFYLDGINSANFSGGEGFYEFLNGNSLNPSGLKFQAWSAAAGIIAYESVVNGEELFL